MKAFLSGVAVMIVIAVAAAFGLNSLPFSSAEEVTSDHGTVRLGDDL